MPILRHPTSPIPGRSIWITSAPISAASSAANGCAIRVPVETIFTPCSGPNSSVTRFSMLMVPAMMPVFVRTWAIRGAQRS